MVVTIANRTQGEVLDMQSKDLSELRNLDFKSSYNFISEDESDIVLDFTDNYSLAGVFYASGVQLKGINSFIALYCFRHAIELYIKFCLSCYSEELKKSGIMYSHNLMELYEKFNEYTKIEILKEKVLELKPVISKLSENEDKENSYRYGNQSHEINKYNYDLDKLDNFVNNLRILCEFWYKSAGGNWELTCSRFENSFKEIENSFKELKDILVKFLGVYNDN